jgi:hypothetical protein
VSLCAFQRGIVVGGDEGDIWTFESQQSENNPLRLMQEQVGQKHSEKGMAPTDEITSMVLSKGEDCLYLITGMNQLMQINNIALDGSDSD